MSQAPAIDVVIPALNEEESLPKVLQALDQAGLRRVVVCDNGSTDRTAEVARAAGATVVYEGERGYGAACLRALAELKEDPPAIVVFIDGDLSDDPSQLVELVAPILHGDAELCVGSRVRGERERGALTVPQRVGNLIACQALRWGYGARYTDLGPFRAITWEALERLAMADRNFGWTVEMQIKAAQRGIAHAEIPVRYRRRHAGQSKISGDLRGSIMAGRIIISTLIRSHRAGAKQPRP